MDKSKVYESCADMLRRAARHMKVASLGDKPENILPALKRAEEDVEWVRCTIANSKL